MKPLLPFFAIIFFVLLFGFSSCDPATVQRLDKEESFFDLKSYFKTEANKLSKIKLIEKTVEINGKREKNNLSNINLPKELSVFSEADINRVSWKDKYQVDSILNNLGEVSKLKYLAIDKNMKTQSLYISFKNNFVDSIFIKNQTTGFATQNQKEMIYIPDVGYSIKSHQRTLIGSSQHFGVDVKFID